MMKAKSLQHLITLEILSITLHKTSLTKKWHCHEAHFNKLANKLALKLNSLC